MKTGVTSFENEIFKEDVIIDHLTSHNYLHQKLSPTTIKRIHKIMMIIIKVKHPVIKLEHMVITKGIISKK